MNPHRMRHQIESIFRPTPRMNTYHDGYRDQMLEVIDLHFNGKINAEKYAAAIQLWFDGEDPRRALKESARQKRVRAAAVDAWQATRKLFLSFFGR